MKRKGFFITMDAAMGLLVVLLVISTTVTLIELTKQKSTIELTRQARDLIDFNYFGGANSAWIKTDCTGATNIASMNSYQYNNNTKSIDEINIEVCE